VHTPGLVFAICIVLFGFDKKGIGVIAGSRFPLRLRWQAQFNAIFGHRRGLV
jgi:hypothetical protein